MEEFDLIKERQRGKDTALFKERTNVTARNANLFISNNSNPFLISPYAPPANVAKASLLTLVSTYVSTITGDLSTILNFSTLTLYICTIQPARSDPTQTLHINASTIDINGAPGATMNVYISSYFNYINTRILQASTIATSTLRVNSTIQASTISATGPINYVSLLGSTIQANTILSYSTIGTSTLTTSTLNYLILSGSTIATSTLLVSTVADISTLNASTINFRIAKGSTIDW
jgi:hypothetical protein